MTTYNKITKELLEKVEDDLVHGYIDEEGNKVYPEVKDAAEWYNVSYATLRKKVGKLNWQQRRTDYKAKVNRKVQEKRRKNDEEISEAEAEAIIVEDYKFNKTANKLRREVDRQLDLLDKGEVVIKVLEDGTLIKGRPSNTPYQLMNLGKALDAAQKVSKVAAGEPSEISKVEGKIEGESFADEFNKIMDNALENIDESED